MAILISNRHRDGLVRALTAALNNLNATAEQRRQVSVLLKYLQSRSPVSAADFSTNDKREIVSQRL